MLTAMEKWFYFCGPTNLALHDLTIHKFSPKALQLLLVLGVSFCLNLLRPTLNIDKSMERFERDFNSWNVFTVSEDLIPLSKPKTYVRSKWKPCAWDISLSLKRRLRIFFKGLELKFRFHPICHNNLPHQRRIISFIIKNPKLMAVQTDKGLGPGAIYPKKLFRFANQRPSHRDPYILTSDPSGCSVLCRLTAKNDGEMD